MKNTKRFRLMPILLAALVLGALLAWGASRSREAASPAPAAVERALEFAREDIALATRENIARMIPVTGTLSALEQSVIKTRAPGVLTQVLAREGESVRQGQLVARVDATEVRALLAAREADTAAARAQLDWAQRNLRRQAELLDKGFISANAYDSVRNEEAVARAKLDAALAQAAQVRKSLADQTLLSPITGIIARRHAEPGERLPADAAILTVVSLDQLEFAADVPSTEIAAVSIGQSVRVRVDGFSDKVFEGRVERINPQATAGAGVIPIYVTVSNPGHGLRAGLFAHGELIASSAQARVTIPAAGVHQAEAGQYVYVVDNGKVVRRPVQVAFLVDERAVLDAGVNAGEIVVGANLGLLPENAPARLPGRALSSATSAGQH
jgi:RND family efflux transporter MFP subunit